MLVTVLFLYMLRSFLCTVIYSYVLDFVVYPLNVINIKTVILKVYSFNKDFLT